MEQKQTQMSLQIDLETKKKLAELSKHQDRSMSATIRTLVAREYARMKRASGSELERR